jgi:hypothetical protein
MRMGVGCGQMKMYILYRAESWLYEELQSKIFTARILWIVWDRMYKLLRLVSNCGP